MQTKYKGHTPGPWHVENSVVWAGNREVGLLQAGRPDRLLMLDAPALLAAAEEMHKALEEIMAFNERASGIPRDQMTGEMWQEASTALATYRKLTA